MFFLREPSFVRQTAARDKTCAVLDGYAGSRTLIFAAPYCAARFGRPSESSTAISNGTNFVSNHSMTDTQAISRIFRRILSAKGGLRPRPPNMLQHNFPTKLGRSPSSICGWLAPSPPRNSASRALESRLVRAVRAAQDSRPKDGPSRTAGDHAKANHLWA